MTEFREIVELKVEINAQDKFEIMVAFETHDGEIKEYPIVAAKHLLRPVLENLLEKVGH